MVRMMMKVLCFMIASIMASVLYTDADDKIISITCLQVTKLYIPCIKHFQEGGKSHAPPPPCCDGLRQLVDLTKKQIDRIYACLCIGSFTKQQARNVTDDMVKGVDLTCRLNVPYLPPSTDCGKVQ
nr:hypothetical protein [Tanacetum cinerariifolium]